MSLVTKGSIYIIDSKDRIDTVGSSGSDFLFKINIPKSEEYDRVCVLQALIPKSYWLVNAPYNYFTLVENGVSTVIYLKEGNYNARSFCYIMSQLLTSSSTQGWSYSITMANPQIDVETGLFIYTVTGNGLNQPSFIFPQFGVHEQFGFHPYTEWKFVDNTLTSEHVVKFQVEDIIYIHTDLCKNNDQSAKSDVIQEIYAGTTPNFSNIRYQNTGNFEAYSKELVASESNVFRLTYTDENENKINFRGLNTSTTIFIYKKDDINNLIAKSLLTDRTLFTDR